ncbi:DNA-binding transcriptional LysR family regulator [Sporomusaceae bacterium BoRhaA]|uniref:LysR family transcriptional regulator n=1 Tax=Pelorhabdus rhamnosifermentans TaxID=2772457 RepID=UPI001C063199|nr:LysR family transcriptional regulator [Pelorhabdus rhamnosifermentans]MBU2701351.1 DNA-binding transcriptional LysR family regulator [Pelorhabdus rhamnosifermentans]
MTLRHMRIFICVCDENNMTKAAIKLHMTQPSVSLAIQELESHYKTLLFERLGHRLFITEAGQRLLIYARHIVNLNQQAEASMQSYGEHYKLRIGASVTIGESVLVDLVQYMYKINPQQEIFSEIHNTAELETMLLKDDLDMALVEGKIQSEYLIVQPFMSDELVFIISPQSSILEKDEITLSDLAELSFFVREAGSGTRDLFENTMQQHDIKIRIAGAYNNAETIKKAVIAGLGASVISRRAVSQELKQGNLASFEVKNIAFKRNFSVVYHKNKYLSPALQSMIALCHNFESIT